jgi:hypothetical protein
MLKKIIAREFQRVPGNVPIPSPNQIFSGEEFFSVEINVPGDDADQQQMRVVVQPRMRKQLLSPLMQNHSTKMRIWKDTVSSAIAPQ